jgi:hypothetical protein
LTGARSNILLQKIRPPRAVILVRKWHFCSKITFLFANGILVRKWHCCSKMTFLFANGILVRK